MTHGLLWRVFSASVTGKRNLEQATAGQDASHCLVSDDLLVAIVCDGAGSVRDGRAGANLIARRVSEELSSALLADPTLHGVQRDDGVRLAEAVRAVIDRARTLLAQVAESHHQELHDFACTLVGCVVSSNGGCLFHIGDGFAIQQEATGSAVLSLPENGEYADETYFVTDATWQEHLRFTKLAAPGGGCMIGLMTDGTSPFAIDRERTGFFRPFIDPVTKFLRDSSPSDGNEALRNLLESPRASDISSDDKTLLLALAAVGE